RIGTGGEGGGNVACRERDVVNAELVDESVEEGIAPLGAAEPIVVVGDRVEQHAGGNRRGDWRPIVDVEGNGAVRTGGGVGLVVHGDHVTLHPHGQAKAGVGEVFGAG